MFRIKTGIHIYRFKQPVQTSRGVYTERRAWFLAADDRLAVGEATPLPEQNYEYSPKFDAVLRKQCHHTGKTGTIDYEALRPYPSITFALETLLLHRRAGASFRFYDTPFSRGEAGIPINGLVWMGKYEEMAERIEAKLREGFRCIKLKIGALPFEDELSLLRQVRSRYTAQEVELRVDANGAFPAEEAMRKLDALAAFELHSIEQPIRAGQYAALEKLCRDTPVPIALDEELIGVYTPEEKRQLLETIRPQYIVLKPSLHGGLHGSEEWIAAAEKLGIGTWITSALESNIGLNAIAQWTAFTFADKAPRMHGLGTGNLFVKNFPLPLCVENSQLWYRSEEGCPSES